MVMMMVYDASTFWPFFKRKDTGVQASGAFAPDDWKTWYANPEAPKVIASDDVHWYVIPGRQDVVDGWWPLLFAAGWYTPNTLDDVLVYLPPVPGAVLSIQDIALLQMKWIYEKGAAIAGRPHPLYYPNSNPVTIPCARPFIVQPDGNWRVKRANGLNLVGGNVSIDISAPTRSGGLYPYAQVPYLESPYITTYFADAPSWATDGYASYRPKIDFTGTYQKLTNKYRFYTKIVIPSDIESYRSLSIRLKLDTSGSTHKFVELVIGSSDVACSGTVWCKLNTNLGSGSQYWAGYLTKGETYIMILDQTLDSPTNQSFNIQFVTNSWVTVHAENGRTATLSGTPCLKYEITPITADTTATVKLTYFYYNDTGAFPIRDITLNDVTRLQVYTYMPDATTVCMFDGDPGLRESGDINDIELGTQATVRLASIPEVSSVGFPTPAIGSANISSNLSLTENVHYDAIMYARKPITHDTWSNGSGRALVGPFSGLGPGYPMTSSSTYYVVRETPNFEAITNMPFDTIIQQVGGRITINRENESLQMSWPVIAIIRDVPDEFAEMLYAYLLKQDEDYMDLYLTDEEVTPFATALNYWSNISFKSITLSQRAMMFCMTNLALSQALNAICDYLVDGVAYSSGGMSVTQLLATPVPTVSGAIKPVSTIYANRMNGTEYTDEYVQAYTMLKEMAVRADKAHSLSLLLSSAANSSNSITNTLESIVAMSDRTTATSWQEAMTLLNLTGDKGVKKSVLQGYCESLATVSSIQGCLEVLADTARSVSRSDSAANMKEIAMRMDMDQLSKHMHTGAGVDPDCLFIMPDVFDDTGVINYILGKAFNGSGENAVLLRTSQYDQQYLGEGGLSDELSFNWFLDALTIPFMDSDTGDYRYNPSGELPSLANPSYSWQMKIPAVGNLSIIPDANGLTQVFGRYLTIPMPWFDLLICLKDYVSGANPHVTLGMSAHPRLRGGSDADMLADMSAGMDKLGYFITKAYLAFNPNDTITYSYPSGSVIANKLDVIKESAAMYGVADLCGDALIGGAMGAATGACIGTVLGGPGIGTAVGASVGILVGGLGPIVESLVINDGSCTDVMKAQALNGINTSIDIQNYESWGRLLDTPLTFKVNGVSYNAAESEAFMGNVLANWIMNGGVNIIRSVPGVYGAPALPSYMRPSFKFSLKSSWEETADFVAAISATAIVMGTAALLAISRKTRQQKVKTTLNLDVLGITRYNLLDRSRIKKASKTYDLVEDLMDNFDTDVDVIQGSLISFGSAQEAGFDDMSDQFDEIDSNLVIVDSKLDSHGVKIDDTKADMLQALDASNTLISNEISSVVSSLKRPMYIKR